MKKTRKNADKINKLAMAKGNDESQGEGYDVNGVNDDVNGVNNDVNDVNDDDNDDSNDERNDDRIMEDDGEW